MRASRYGNNIKAYRKQKGLSQKELADLVGLDQQDISRIESGNSLPQADILFDIAAALECPMEALVKKEVAA